MRFVDAIARKRDGHALSRAEIDAFVRGVTDGSIPDYQASALLMAIVLKGMTDEETAWLTDAMVRSGERIDLSDIPGIKVGKHSTGGVGDKTSIVLAPVAAACGVIVPKMSGRGLGHTGGTLDKLESIPGYRIGLTIDEFKSVLREVGTSIIGQTAALAPADKKLYALRDVTATIESIPLISASIMSKKLAEGSNALVLDVKCGDGAFMKDVDRARELAASMVAIGRQAGVRTEAVITDMDAPLGRAIGNSLEIIECLDTLKGNGPSDLTLVVKRLAARMVVLAGLADDEHAAGDRVEQALGSGRALETFARMVERQGGNPRVADDYSLLPSAPGRTACPAPRGGYLTALKAEALGRASNVLGAGRTMVGESVDHGVGVVVLAKPGDRVSEGQPLVELHHRDGRGLDAALELCRAGIRIGDAPPAQRDKILGEVR
ncbi:MAG TPA: thymidine phosphorylase [Vicinamibacterales bacterium]|jgi:pyrimidine-nucleoside phosphorylase|nr:thymidine phosphorylase [Vicinamibacterales bacterium]